MGNIKTFTIGEVCEVIAGQSPPSDTYNFEQKGLPFFQGKADFGEIYPVNRMWCDKPIKIAQSGDILLSVRAPVGPTNLCKEKCCIGRGLSAIRPGKDADPKYILYFFRSIEKKLSEQGRGSTFSAITQSEIRNIKIPLPPLPEQKRIAAILDMADAVRRKRQETIRLLDEFLRSVFLEMFGDPVRNEKGWEKRKIKDVIIGKPNNGIFKKNEEYGGSIPVIWVEELYQSTMLYGLKSRRLNPTTNEIKKYGLKNGDILFCRSSLKKEGVGYSNIYNGPDNLCLFECHLIRISPDKSKINPFFFNYLLRHESMRKVIIGRSNTVTMTTIGQDKIKEIEVIVPSLDLQNELSKLIKKIEQQKQLLEKSLNEMKVNFNSLMQQAFPGEL